MDVILYMFMLQDTSLGRLEMGSDCPYHIKTPIENLVKVDPSRANKPKERNENCRPDFIESVHER